MKKTLFLASFFAAFAMMSYGGNAVLAHAQTATTTATPANATTLQQELDDAKAQLVQLQMEAGKVPAGDSSLPMSSVAPIVTVTPTMTLSATDASEINSVLTALTAMLTSLQSKIAQDPQFATSNGNATVASLQAIGNTLATIVTDAAHGTNNNIAMVTPRASVSRNITPTTGATMPSTQNSAPAATAPAVTPTTPVTPTPVVTPAPAPVAANTVPQTAQAAASFSLGALNWPLIIVIILIVAAIAIWLWWDDSDDTKQTVVVKTTVSPAPQRPLQPSNPVSMSTNGQGQNSRPVSGPQTPLSSAVSPQGNR